MEYGIYSSMVTETKRRSGTYICWRCHREFPLYEGENKHYCSTCFIEQAQEAGKRGGRPKKAAVV